MADELPVRALLPRLREQLETATRLVLEAPPGAGKTTQVPPALLGAGWLAGRRILMLEPRRLAARAAAGFMAAERGEAVGDTIGYRVRFDSRVSAATRIEVVTEGLFTRMIQGDPALDGVGAVIFDEFHERHLDGDLGLALALDVQASLRPDLRLLLMSATLDGERIAAWLEAPRLASAGRSHPVRIEHPPARPRETALAQLARVLPQTLAGSEGDVLVFLPGKREIERARQLLGEVLARQPGEASAGVALLPLHGDLPLEAQRAALAPAAPGTRHVLLATNVAESSVTAPGVRVVIDSGLAREPRFDPRSGLTRLETVAISQASADQRAGRAGRVAPGVALRLWPHSQRLEATRRPELMQAELSALALELAAWGSDELRWLDAPPAGALAQARDLLHLLGALDAAARITPLGRRMLDSGAPPRLAAAVVRARPEQRALLPDMLALMESRSPLRGEAAHEDDVRQRLAALQAWRAGRRSAGASAGALAAIDQLAKNWRRRLRLQPPPGALAGPYTLGDLLLPAFPDRVAHVDAGDPLRYHLASGRGARLHEASSLRGEPWLLALDLEFDAHDSLLRSALPFDPARLAADWPQRFSKQRVQTWNEARQAAEVFVEQRFGAIVLERRSVPADADDALPALLDAVRRQGLEALPWTAATRQLRARIECLREWQPGLGLPDVAPPALLETLEDWLAPFLAGATRIAAINGATLAKAIDALIDHDQRQALAAQAPARLRVPSGREHRIDYAAGQPPVLAVKLQELFGLAETPRIAGGAVPLTLHLLSPAGRPMQVTQDLESFWQRTYPEVRKELKGRYPKHPWPEDPWKAMPTARTTRRSFT